MSRPDYFGFIPQRGQPRRRSGWRGSVRLGALFAVLVLINIYVFFFRGGTSIHDVLKTSAISKKSVTLGGKSRDAVFGKLDPLAREVDDSIIVQGSMKGFLGLSTALTVRKLDPQQVTELIEALRPELNLKALKPEHSFEVRLDPKTGRIRRFTYKLSSISEVEVIRTSSGGLKAQAREQKLVTKEVRIAGRIDSSLDQAMAQAGETSALVALFVDLFSWDINWYTDPRDDDEFRIIVEKQYLGEKFYRYGHVLAAEYRGKVGRFQVFYYKARNGAGGHFVPEGRSIRRAFLKTPLNFRRLSSKFNTKRFHPVLHQTKGHFGVDYAAPVGTPVWASSDGVVVSANRSGGAGNMVVLSHAGGISTVYMHLSRFAKGLKAGQKVTQRQVIGYVGTTGLSTGPHLHYGTKVAGRYVNPLHFKVRQGEMLSKSDRIHFLDGLPEKLAALENIPLLRTAAKSPAE